MNYGTLKTSVADYMHRTDLTSFIPGFIEQARVRIGGDLRALANYTTGTVTGFTSSRTALPANLAELVAVLLDGQQLLYVNPGEVANYSGGVYSTDGVDLVVPGAGSTTSVTLTFYAIPTAFVLDADVSVPMVQWPQLWIYASCAEAAQFTGDYERLGSFNEAYNALITVANQTGNEGRMQAPAMQSDQPSAQSMSRL